MGFGFISNIKYNCKSCTAYVGEGGFLYLTHKHIKKHIMYTFNGFRKVVICNVSIIAWRDCSRKYKRDVSLDYFIATDLYSSCIKRWSFFHMRESEYYPI